MKIVLPLTDAGVRGLRPKERLYNALQRGRPVSGGLPARHENLAAEIPPERQEQVRDPGPVSI
jgi:hypothetical protein